MLNFPWRTEIDRFLSPWTGRQNAAKQDYLERSALTAHYSPNLTEVIDLSKITQVELNWILGGANGKIQWNKERISRKCNGGMFVAWSIQGKLRGGTDVRKMRKTLANILGS